MNVSIRLWLVGYGAALIFALAGMSTLVMDRERTLFGLGAIIVLSYIVLTALIFWLGRTNPRALGAAIFLLLFAGAFFNDGDYLTKLFGWLPGTAYWVAATRTLGMGALVSTLFLATTYQPISILTKGVWLLWALWLPYWFFGIYLQPLPTAQQETFALIGTTIPWIMTLLLQSRELRRTYNHQELLQRVWVTTGFAIAGIGFLAIWYRILTVYSWHSSQVSALSTAFAVPPYLLTWLAIPFTLVMAMWHAGLWQDKNLSESQS